MKKISLMLSFLLLISAPAFAATKAFIVVKGLADRSGSTVVKFDTAASATSLRQDEELVVNFAWTPTQLGSALKTKAAALCNESDPSLNLTAADFVIQ